MAWQFWLLVPLGAGVLASAGSDSPGSSSSSQALDQSRAVGQVLADGFRHKNRQTATNVQKRKANLEGLEPYLLGKLHSKAPKESLPATMSRGGLRSTIPSTDEERKEFFRDRGSHFDESKALTARINPSTTDPLLAKAMSKYSRYDRTMRMHDNEKEFHKKLADDYIHQTNQYQAAKDRLHSGIQAEDQVRHAFSASDPRFTAPTKLEKLGRSHSVPGQGLADFVTKPELPSKTARGELLRQAARTHAAHLMSNQIRKRPTYFDAAREKKMETLMSKARDEKSADKPESVTPFSPGGASKLKDFTHHFDVHTEPPSFERRIEESYGDITKDNKPWEKRHGLWELQKHRAAHEFPWNGQVSSYDRERPGYGLRPQAPNLVLGRSKSFESGLRTRISDRPPGGPAFHEQLRRKKEADREHAQLWSGFLSHGYDEDRKAALAKKPKAEHRTPWQPLPENYEPLRFSTQPKQLDNIPPKALQTAADQESAAAGLPKQHWSKFEWGTDASKGLRQRVIAMTRDKPESRGSISRSSSTASDASNDNKW